MTSRVAEISIWDYDNVHVSHFISFIFNVEIDSLIAKTDV